jgi:hypothetical protein
MVLKLIRDTFSDTTTIGKLYIDGTFECYTLEDKDRYLEAGGLKIPHLTAIPRGTYKVELRFSPHFNCITPHLIDVNGFEYVLIHWGNYAKDTDGCILVGQTRDTDFIGQSKAEFAILMSKIQVAFDNKEDVEIEVC